MKVLMISIDKGLLGRGQLGDVVERHRRYGEFCERLDIIVLSQPGFVNYQISDKVMVYPTNSKKKWKYFFDAKRIGRGLFRQTSYDLVVTQEPFLTGLVGVGLKKKFSSKLLVHFHGDFVGLPLLFAKLFVLPKADGIRVMSEGQKEKLIRAGISEKRIRVISTPVDLMKFETYGEKASEEELLRNLTVSAREIKFVLMVGRKDLVKDFDTLFKAMNLVYEKHPETGLWLVGNYTNYSEVKQRLNLPADKIIFTSRVSSNDLAAYYKIAYLTVLSSISESFGKVLIEANACGKPVVSTATTGAKEIIKDGENGFLVPIKDCKGLAKKIIYLLENPEVAKQMGEKGRTMVKEKFSDNTGKIIQFWNNIINNKL
ncbi:MAG: glycosyltransferase family 4 protein [Patescibacteria group bacterium]